MTVTPTTRCLAGPRPPMGVPRPEAAPHLQDDPVPLLRSHVQGVLGHHLLPLPQGHIVELPVVDGEAQLLP